MSAGSWSLAEELFNREDPGFVDELRRVHYAERLGDFAKKWIVDTRPFARQALFNYLSRPLNCYRHEPLVKRLFKLAEQAGDDELMGAFLVAFDCSIRRQRRTRRLYEHEAFRDQEAATAAVQQWEAQGYENVNVTMYNNWYYASAWKTEQVVIVPGNTKMPRPTQWHWKKNQTIGDWLREHYERKYVLFSPQTRRYLRRRAWRYFRRIGQSDPARYVRAAAGFLTRYTDADIDSEIHLLDNWGLMHTLFYHSPALVCPAKGWDFAPGKSLADLAPAPRFESAWSAAPQAVFDVLLEARSRAVRQWAIWMIRKHHEAWLVSQPVSTLLRLADHADPDLSSFGFDLLQQTSDLATVPVKEWLARLNSDDLDKLKRLSDLLIRRLDPSLVMTADAIRLAMHRTKPVAELGLTLLQQKSFTEADAASLLSLVQAECAAVRPELTRWLRGTLEGFGCLRAEWVQEFLDSKHADVRAAGWAWLNESPLRDEPIVWHRLVESPYDDIRGPLVAELNRRAHAADPDTIRLLWATVLLNVARGGRYKPGVVAQIVARLARHPGEADRLLPLLAVAVRSLRGPEFRAGLAGVVGLAENEPALVPVIRERFPELEI